MKESKSGSEEKWNVERCGFYGFSVFTGIHCFVLSLMVRLRCPTPRETDTDKLTQNRMGISVDVCLSAMWTPHNAVQPIFISLGIGLDVGQCEHTITKGSHGVFPQTHVYNSTGKTENLNVQLPILGNYQKPTNFKLRDLIGLWWHACVTFWHLWQAFWTLGTQQSGEIISSASITCGDCCLRG